MKMPDRDLIEIDGSQGEGGGQILRTSLSLSAITGRPVRISNIRSGRANPGLAPQHLTAVRSLAAVCDADVSGDALLSQQLFFRPNSLRGGEYRFDVAAEAGRGSAGSTILILQSLLLPLLFAGETSRVHLAGGTHVIRSPSFEYLDRVYLPVIRRMGARANARLLKRGYYPRGGGAAELTIPEPGVSSGPGGLSSVRILDRSRLHRATIFAFATSLPEHIPHRMAGRAKSLLESESMPCEVRLEIERGDARGPGAGIFLLLEYENSCAGFAAIGRRGVPSEQVAEEACEELLEFHRGRGGVDLHLADQLLLPAALAKGRSEYTVDHVTGHLATNAEVIRAFLGDCIRIESEPNGGFRVIVDGVGFQP